MTYNKREYGRRWYNKHIDEARAKQRERRRREYKENPGHFIKLSKERRKKAREGAIQRLGGQCVGCGIDDIRVLQINHLNGDGKRELHQAYTFYLAVANGRRRLDDLDLRCANCNILFEYERGARS